jgi:indolepyruvate ferredoxin oxidoreductase beta subunit
VRALNFVLVGVGGQGILLASDVLCHVAMAAGYDVKKTDVHGMAQRGGSVISHMRMASQVAAPVVPMGAADFLLGFEKLEACRWAGYLKQSGIAVVNDEAIPTLEFGSSGPAIPYPDDTAISTILHSRARQVVMVPASRLATALGNVRVANLVLLGALSHFMEFSPETWHAAIEERVPPKFRQLNQRAFDVGRAEGGVV